MREKIPESTKRKVRQHCGFCCVFCGSPIYDYDHIVEYSIVKEHSPENLVLLCPTCHRKKTKGLISRETIIWAKANAKERVRTFKDNIPLQAYTIDIGSNTFRTFAGFAFSIYDFGELYIKFDQVPLINCEIIDGKRNKAIEIVDNNYTLCTSTWDIEYVGNTLTFRNGPRQIFASITLDIENKKIVLKGNIELSNGVKIKINENGIFANDHLLAKDNHIFQSLAGIIITDRPVEDPFIVSGRVRGNFFSGIDGIAVLNSIDCEGNRFGTCKYCFLWTKTFLDNFKNKS